jgi:fructose-1-phosphate kinase PfkB-like protein
MTEKSSSPPAQRKASGVTLGPEVSRRRASASFVEALRQAGARDSLVAALTATAQSSDTQTKTTKK